MQKDMVKDYLLAGDAADGGQRGWGYATFASVWHILAILYLGLLWILFVKNITAPVSTTQKGAFILSFFVVPIWIVVDKIVQWLVFFAMSTLNLHHSHHEENEEVKEGYGSNGNGEKISM